MNSAKPGMSNNIDKNKHNEYNLTLVSKKQIFTFLLKKKPSFQIEFHSINIEKQQ
jgi:hypothetical protein